MVNKMNKFILFALFILCAGVLNPVLAQPALTDSKPVTKFNIEVSGTGARNFASVEMIAGGKQSIKARASNNGAFAFPVLAYNPSEILNIGLSIPVVHPQTKQKLVDNILTISYNPFKGTAEIKGVATPSGMIVGNMSAEDSYTAIANDEARFALNLSSRRGIDDTESSLIISIINVQAGCCPRTFEPVKPVTITIKTTEPPALVPQPNKNIKQKQGSYTIGFKTENRAFAVSVPPDQLEQNWIDAIQIWSAHVGATILAKTALYGNLLNTQMQLAFLKEQQKRQAQTLLDSSVSNQVCRAATLSHSLGKADFRTLAEQRVLARILQERDLGKEGSLHFENEKVNLTTGLQARIVLFKETYCDKYAENSSLARVCKVNLADNLNRDIDYTRVIDVPKTLAINFTGNQTLEPDEADVIAFGENLFPSMPIASTNRIPQSSETYMDLRSLQAARAVARNSFAAVVSEKASVENPKAMYAHNLLKSMNVDPREAELLLGRNPSYFAQMNLLTKTLYQTTDFAKGLMTGGANVERARVAMKAVDLQQNADLLDSLYRREMLLATYLEQMLAAKQRRLD